MEADAGAAVEDGEIEGSQADEEEEQADGGEREEDAAFEGKGARTMGSVWSRCSWRGRGGRGRGGFHHRPWYGAAE
jgi:hypothetical protein